MGGRGGHSVSAPQLKANFTKKTTEQKLLFMLCSWWGFAAIKNNQAHRNRSIEDHAAQLLAGNVRQLRHD